VKAPLVLKLGGELIEAAADRARLGSAARAIADSRPLVVVHGGGRAVDAAMARQGLSPRKIDGLRVTDAETLDVVVSVLGGLSNTALVASLVGAGVRAVGLSGVDAGLGRAARASAHRTASGAVVDLGCVGDPLVPDTSLLRLLLDHGYVPVIASLGLSDGPSGGPAPVERSPAILNVNADVMACRLAVALDSADLVIAGGTAGVHDANGRAIPDLTVEELDALVADGTASSGMVAKLVACGSALAGGVASVRIIDGRALDAALPIDRVPGTTLRHGAAGGRRKPAAPAACGRDGRSGGLQPARQETLQ
jgi:acetylglutamate kinase